MNLSKFLLGALVAGFTAASHAQITLYNQNFENPVNFVNDGGDVNISRTVNALYADQPAGFRFAQQFTVETLRVGGNSAWSVPANPTGGFKDPQGKAGNYVLGMLSSAQNDLLALSFDVGDFSFLNLQLDFSSIDLNNFGGPFFDGKAPKFQFSLYDNPSGVIGLGSGTLLSSAIATGTVSANRWTFDWTSAALGLSTAGNTNGKVTLQIDLLEGGYAALDNFKITADNTRLIPEPSTWMLLSLGLLAFMGYGRARLAK